MKTYGFKRTFDLLAVILSAPIWLPVFLLLAFIVKATSRGSVFFLQKRYGTNKQFFTIYKFRSMYTTAPKDVPTHLLQNPHAFITPVGRFLRKSSLDELPQLLNILKGELSLVGPRPALWNQDDLIAEREKYGANSVPVGLTGLAQISGRDELPIEKKAALDGLYAQKISFLLDIKIILLTLAYSVVGRGVREGQHRT
ncbi:MAG: sugar transferase [Defluviitaleaceae bacterium]|nr:sugar transferase [Defluviitaleaceae bacterium]